MRKRVGRITQLAMGFAGILLCAPSPAAADASTLKHPIVLVAGTLGSWGSITFEALAKRAANPAFGPEVLGEDSSRGRAGQTDAATGSGAPTLIAGALGLSCVRIAVDQARSQADRRLVMDYSSSGLVHQAPDVWYLDPVTEAYTAFLDYCVRPKPRGLGLTLWRDVFIFCWDGIFESVEANARHLGAFVKSVTEATGADSVQLVAHSQGGIVAREFVQRQGGAPLVSNLVLVGVPLKGAYAVQAVMNTGVFPVVLPIAPWRELPTGRLEAAMNYPMEAAKAAVEAVLMNAGLWCISSEGPAGRQKALKDSEDAFADKGETSPLAAMTPGYSLEADAQALASGEPRVPRVTTVLSVGRPTLKVSGYEGHGKPYVVVRDGDGTVTDEDSRDEALAGEVYAHIAVTSIDIPHRSYFQTPAFLKPWVDASLDLTPQPSALVIGGVLPQ